MKNKRKFTIDFKYQYSSTQYSIETRKVYLKENETYFDLFEKINDVNPCKNLKNVSIIIKEEKI